MEAWIDTMFGYNVCLMSFSVNISLHGERRDLKNSWAFLVKPIMNRFGYGHMLCLRFA